MDQIRVSFAEDSATTDFTYGLGPTMFKLRAEDSPALTEYFPYKQAIPLKKSVSRPLTDKIIQILAGCACQRNIRDLQSLSCRVTLDELQSSCNIPSKPDTIALRAPRKAGAPVPSKRVERELIFWGLQWTD